MTNNLVGVIQVADTSFAAISAGLTPSAFSEWSDDCRNVVECNACHRTNPS
jgi:hypothetical protein